MSNGWFGRKLFAGLFIGMTTLAPLAVGAAPPYAHPDPDEVVRGRITEIPGAFSLEVRDDRGYVDDVALHHGTIINPTGLSLAVGMRVTIHGHADGPVLDANEIDTPYHYSGGAPVPVYYGPGYWYPGFGYGYGPSYSLTVIDGPRYLVGRHPFYHDHPWHEGREGGRRGYR